MTVGQASLSPCFSIFPLIFLHFFIIFSVFVALPFVSSAALGCRVGKRFRASVIWEVLRDVPSLGCLPAGAVSHQRLCSLICGTDACHANVPKLSRHNRTLVISCDLTVKTSDYCSIAVLLWVNTICQKHITAFIQNVFHCVLKENCFGSYGCWKSLTKLRF